MAIFPGSAIPSAASAYTIDQSLYIGDAPDSSVKISRVLDSAGSVNPKWTFATWWKKGNMNATEKAFFHIDVETPHTVAFVTLNMKNDNIAPSSPIENAGLTWLGYFTGGWDWSTASKRFHDWAGWMHVCQVTDYSDATNPVMFYFNGVAVPNDTDFWDSTKTGAGWATNFSPVSGDTFYVGCNDSEQNLGYIADTYFIEGQALHPVDTFGEFSSDTGEFVPIEYEGTYSGNSFYLDYADSSDFGTDRSGLGNDFTIANIGAGQQRPDTPTNNFAVLNPVMPSTNGATYNLLTEGNLRNSPGGAQWSRGVSTFGAASGKWYFEVYIGAMTNNGPIGVRNDVGLWDQTGWPPGYAEWGPESGGYLYRDGIADITGVGSFAATNIVSVAVNMDDGEIQWFLNGAVLSGSGNVPVALPATTQNGFIAYGAAYSDDHRWNFGQDSSFSGTVTAQNNADSNGQGDFYYTPPSGFLALCSSNLPTPAIANSGDYFNTIIYDDGAGAKTGVGFKPDFTWFKARGSGSDKHKLTNSVRGVTKAYSLALYDTSAETTDTTGVTAIGADGFTVGADSAYSSTTGVGMVAFNWLGGGAPTATNSAGAGAVPTAGSVKIDGANLGSALAGTNPAKKISANTESGFSIVSYAGILDPYGVQTIAHGLSKAPEIIIGANLTDATQGRVLGATIFNASWEWVAWIESPAAAYDTGSGMWNDTAPTSSVWTVNDAQANAHFEKEYLMYCFHSVDGFSKVGSYVGNGLVNGTFVYTGFRPMWIMSKCIGQSADWLMTDSVRLPYNVTKTPLFADSVNAEATDANNAIDIFSNGFKCRGVNNNINNSSGDSYIYLAFAETPFKTANARF